MERMDEGPPAPLDARERALAALAGAAQGYANFRGEWTASAPDALRAMLAALGYPAGAQARDSLRRLAHVRRAALAPLISARADESTRIALRGAGGPHADWRLTREDGATLEGRSPITRDARARASFALPAQPMGYHTLQACGARATLISAPPRCWTPPGLQDGRLWGLGAQVYALHDAQSLAVGGYREIGALAQAAGARGASFLGLSPLHALFPADRSKRSPYSPSNRMMLETLFIDPRAAPCAPALTKEAAAQAQALRAAPLVDAEAAWALMRPLLAQAWRDFATQGDSEAYRAFRARGGRALEDHALFEALSEAMRAQGRLWSGAWPAELQDPRSAACAQARAQHADAIGFHVFLQWLADAQLAQAASAAHAAGMEIGLYRDLAVGAHRAGSETWSNREDYLLDLSIGAPPDDFAPEGQNWGLPPFDPLRLEQTGLAPFRRILAANMRCAGALRIDHAFQLERLYLAPQGGDARRGVYVASPFAAMLACVRIESQRARCMVIAEDLGTAPPGFSAAIMEAGLISYRLLLFERDAQGAFTPPGRYPADALAAFSTHDLPTLAGWRRGVDIAVRACLDGGAPDDEARRLDVAALDAALAHEGLTPDQDDDEDMRDSVLRFLARTPTRLCLVQTEDLCGEWSQPNLPGPDRGYPNWRRRLALGLEDMTRDGGPLARAADCMKQEGRGLRRAQIQIAAATPHAGHVLRTASANLNATQRRPGRSAPDCAPDLKGRIAVEDVAPSVDGGQWPVKRIQGDSVHVFADVFSDGHDAIDVDLLWRAPSGAWSRAPMRLLENDRWTGIFTAQELGAYVFAIEAWRDPFATWATDVETKRRAGQDVALNLREGAELIARAQGESARRAHAKIEALGESHVAQALDSLLSEETRALMRACGPREDACRSPDFPLRAEPALAGFSTWYEMFPRSAANDVSRHGRFSDVIARLDSIREAGFDVLYFPPIHPIGATNRKGRNNALKAAPDDPGSVYAIGDASGGHDAVHPQLGTLEDFRALVAEARARGLEIALDFAIQCSPDHPWIREHPDWFSWRADGTIRFAENPPKTYEDIVNVRFDGPAMPAAWFAWRDVVSFWIAQGVRIFRVDNPHTKPLPFWRWLICEINRVHPEAIFLSESFTRPKMMKRLAKIGFQQSYTYFTWRNTKQEIIDYIHELDGPMSDYYRPNFFVNTPDINPFYLQTSGWAGFIVRATLAATLSPNWGLYSGFELCEAAPLPGREEYLNSEKYELRARDFDAPHSIIAHIARLNAIRRAHRALQTRGMTVFLNAWDEDILAYARLAPDRSEAILVMVNLNTHLRRACAYEAPLWEFGLPDHGTVDVDDLLSGERFRLHGKTHQIALDPRRNPVIVWRLRNPAGEDRP